MTRTTSFIRAELAENAVVAYRLAAGREPRLSRRDRRRCARLAATCRRGRVARAEIHARLLAIAGVRP